MLPRAVRLYLPYAADVLPCSTDRAAALEAEHCCLMAGQHLWLGRLSLLRALGHAPERWWQPDAGDIIATLLGCAQRQRAVGAGDEGDGENRNSGARTRTRRMARGQGTGEGTGE